MSRRSLTARDYLEHMLDAVNQIEEYTLGKSAADFHADRLLQDGVIRNMEILGEASKNLVQLYPDSTTRFPDIHFVEIYAMRNQLSHGYFVVDMDVVWSVVEQDVPALRTALESAIA